MKSIKDLIYFDIEKANSLISQLNGGLISEISNAVEDESEENSGVGIDLKIIKGNLGDKNKERTLKTEKKSLYHEILNTIEAELYRNELLTSINDSFENWPGSFNDFMTEIPNFSYIKATGWGSFEDFERLKRIMTNFNDIQRLIFGSSFLENSEVKVLKKQLEDAKKIANSNKDRNNKSKELAKIKSIENSIDTILSTNTDIALFDEDWIEKMKIYLDTFSPNRLNFRLLPFDDFAEFQILSNLKDKFLLDENIENTIFTYGARPNIRLTILGIITSCPREKDPRVHPSDEFLIYNEEDLPSDRIFDKAFRNVFDSFEAFEKFFFSPNFPKIAISPVAIYREVKMKENESTNA